LPIPSKNALKAKVVAIDTMPTHRYLPGMRFHIENALALGTSRQELVDVLDISAAAGPGHGVE
jgi:hypothetical protein